MRLIRVEYVNPRELRAAPHNANVMRAEEFAQLCENMRTSGACTSALLTRETAEGLEIVDGHHRARAAVEAGIATVLCLVVDASDGEATLAGLSHNRLRGELDTRVVAELLATLQASGASALDLASSGFKGVELESLLAMTGPAVDLSALVGADTSVRDEEPTDTARVHELRFEFATVESLRAVKRKLTKARGKGENKRSLASALCVLLGLDEEATRE